MIHQRADTGDLARVFTQQSRPQHPRGGLGALAVGVAIVVAAGTNLADGAAGSRLACGVVEGH